MGDIWRLQKTDIDVGRDGMAMKRVGCAVVFSQPSCRTVETRRPGPEWLTTTFETRESLQQPWVYELHESRLLFSETSATCDLIIGSGESDDDRCAECFRCFWSYFGQGLARWVSPSPCFGLAKRCILEVLRIATLSTLFCSPIILFACENNPRPDQTIPLSTQYSHTNDADKPNTQRHRHETSFGIRPHGDARIWQRRFGPVSRQQSGRHMGNKGQQDLDRSRTLCIVNIPVRQSLTHHSRVSMTPSTTT